MLTHFSTLGPHLILWLQKIERIQKNGHINANTIAGFKFHEIKNWQVSGRFNILLITEAKTDGIFTGRQFSVEGFRMNRIDRDMTLGWCPLGRTFVSMRYYVHTLILPCPALVLKGKKIHPCLSLKSKNLLISQKVNGNWIN